MSVAIAALAAVRKSWIGDQPASDASQSFCVRIIDFVFLSDRLYSRSWQIAPSLKFR
jgi:hypothetical protein